ncbi:MAG: FAD-dependent monooxygenase [Clostridia bacterium]|nr:FAD-dependent monooxygenase [Clostridia bacterium]
MIRINDISLPLDYNEETIKKAAAKKLKINVSEIKYASLYKRSVDARKKNNVHFQATVDVKLDGKEQYISDKVSTASVVEEYKYDLPLSKPLAQRPVVVGSGPCGLFAALILAQSGQKPILIERGRDVDSRTSDVNKFWTTGILDTTSNVQFGEGGAGTFSDGKLTTGTKDSRTRKVINEFVENGAPEEILYLAKAHIGTDKLKTTVKNIRKKIISLGGEVLFETKLTGFKTKDGCVTAAVTEHNGTIQTIPTDNIILAIGHSARDTFKMLSDSGIKMEQKAFSMGARIEHLQENINKQQYGQFWNSPYLSAADYKLAVHLKNGRGVYTFCMCPGGSVVAAASEEKRLVTNGMSEFTRDKINANSALLVGINPDDFGSDDVLAGVELQRKLENRAFETGGGNYNAPVQRVCDFLKKQKSTSLGCVIPSYKPGYELTSLDLCLPDYITDSMREGIILMDKKLSGFADGDAVLTAVESRSSSPVRIMRDENMQSVSLKGLYPCGEGAGFAGGIISAAVDGIKAAEMILKLSLC